MLLKIVHEKSLPLSRWELRTITVIVRNYAPINKISFYPGSRYKANRRRTYTASIILYYTYSERNMYFGQYPSINPSLYPCVFFCQSIFSFIGKKGIFSREFCVRGSGQVGYCHRIIDWNRFIYPILLLIIFILVKKTFQ